jgi:hypothetical protein
LQWRAVGALSRLSEALSIFLGSIRKLFLEKSAIVSKPAQYVGCMPTRVKTKRYLRSPPRSKQFASPPHSSALYLTPPQLYPSKMPLERVRLKANPFLFRATMTALGFAAESSKTQNCPVFSRVPRRCAVKPSRRRDKGRREYGFPLGMYQQAPNRRRPDMLAHKP